MDPIEYLRSLRRRWPVILGAAVLAVGLAGLTLTSVEAPLSAGSSYSATTILLTTQSGTPDPRVSGLATVAALTTVGEVPKQAAKRIGYEGDPESLASTVRAVVARDSGLLRITASAATGEQAELVADVFAEELIVYLERRNAQAAEDQAREYRRRISQIEAEIEALDQEIVSAPVSEVEQLKGQRDTKALEAQGLTTQFQQAASGSSGSGLEVIQPALAQAVTPSATGGLQAPRSPASRLAIGAVLGLLAGAALALFLDRFDQRIRTREAAEKSFEATVLAEIPRIPRGSRKHAVVASALPRSPVAEAFRMLGTSVADGLLLGEDAAPPRESNGSTPKVVLVTSSGPSEGKSTVVANLAAALAEIGRRVLVISCDFRQPTVHQLFGVSDGKGLADALRTRKGGAILNGQVQGTLLRGVRVITSDPGPERPAELLTSERMRSLLAEARRDSDVVLLDTPAFLVSSDAANLLKEVDAVLLVARAGKTTTEVARQTVQLLRRLNAPKVAVTLNAAREMSTPRERRRA